MVALVIGSIRCNVFNTNITYNNVKNIANVIKKRKNNKTFTELIFFNNNIMQNFVKM